jgi:hypothetical protein
MIDLRLLSLRDLARLEAEQANRLANIRKAIIARKGSPLSDRYTTPEQAARILGVMPMSDSHPFHNIENS